MSKITVDYTDVIEWDIPENTTIQTLLNDKNLQAAAGFDPQRVRPLVDGCEAPGYLVVRPGSTVTLEDRAASKA